MRSIILIAHNIRSVHNVGSLFRTADGFGIERIICSGYTPYPETIHDTRLPHIRDKLTMAIHKTALGAEQSMPFSYEDSIETAILSLASTGYMIVGLEQHTSSIRLEQFQPPEKIVLILGEEVEGIAKELLALCNIFVEIPMIGSKESYNVSVAGGIAMYHIRTSK